MSGMTCSGCWTRCGARAPAGSPARAPRSPGSTRLRGAAGWGSRGPGGIARGAAGVPGFGSTWWAGGIDAPTWVLIPLRERMVPPRHQFWLADQIPEAQVVTVDAGHACCTLQCDKFVAALRESVDSVGRRIAARPGSVAPG